MPVMPGRAVTNSSVAATWSNWLTMRLPAVRDSPSVATSAVSPITTPKTVSIIRPGRANIPGKCFIKKIAHRDAGAGDRARHWSDWDWRGHRFGCGFPCVMSRQAAVNDMHAAAGPIGDVLVVRHDHQRQPSSFKFSNRSRRLADVFESEISRRLVAQQQARRTHECPSDCDALLFAARELAGQEIRRDG